MRIISLAILTLNGLIGCICIAVLGLTTHSVVLKQGLENEMPTNVKGTGMSLLFWPGAGGLVDMVLFYILWSLTPIHEESVS